MRLATLMGVARGGGGGRGIAIYQVEVRSASAQKVIYMAQISLGNPMLATWMQNTVVPYFQNQIINQFATNGGTGNWLPLEESTLRIRHAMGQTEDDAINERTGEMIEILASQYEINQTAGAAEMMIPGRGTDELTKEKIMTAQMGKSEPNPLFGGKVSITPPRPVLTMSTADRAAVLLMLQQHVIHNVSGMLTLGNLGPL